MGGGENYCLATEEPEIGIEFCFAGESGERMNPEWEINNDWNLLNGNKECNRLKH